MEKTINGVTYVTAPSNEDPYDCTGCVAKTGSELCVKLRCDEDKIWKLADPESSPKEFSREDVITWTYWLVNGCHNKGVENLFDEWLKERKEGEEMSKTKEEILAKVMRLEMEYINPRVSLRVDTACEAMQDYADQCVEERDKQILDWIDSMINSVPIIKDSFAIKSALMTLEKVKKFIQQPKIEKS